jgi:hypothetical protein
VLVLLQYVYGLNILPVIATSTVMTAVLGLALQDTLKNLFAGLTLSLEKRFRQGDWISFKPDSGTLTTGQISEIGWRTIRIRTLDNNYAVVPNATFTNSHITNFSRPVACFVRTIEFPVVLPASMNKASELLLESISSVRGVLSTPIPEVTPISVKLDQVIFRLRFWIDEFDKGDEITGQVIEKSVSRLQDADLIAESLSAVTANVLSSGPNRGANSGPSSSAASGPSGAGTRPNATDSGTNNGPNNLPHNPAAKDKLPETVSSGAGAPQSAVEAKAPHAPCLMEPPITLQAPVPDGAADTPSAAPSGEPASQPDNKAK